MSDNPGEVNETISKDQVMASWLVTKSIRDPKNRSMLKNVRFYMPDISVVSQFEADYPWQEQDPTFSAGNKMRDKDYSGGDALKKRTAYALSAREGFAKMMEPYYKAAKNDISFETFVAAITYTDWTLIMFIVQVLGKENSEGMFQ
jgi:hypothetical protein